MGVPLVVFNRPESFERHGSQVARQVDDRYPRASDLNTLAVLELEFDALDRSRAARRTDLATRDVHNRDHSNTSVVV
jgi:hypothetical protein